jgi:hypothetical protein
MPALANLLKDPDELVSFALDWSDYDPDIDVKGLVVTVQEGLELLSQSIVDGKKTLAFVRGGTAGRTYNILFNIFHVKLGSFNLFIERSIDVTVVER